MTRNVVVRALVVLISGMVALAGVLPMPAQAATEPDGAPTSMTVRGRALVNTQEVIDGVWIVSGAASIKGRVTGSVVVLNGSVAVSGSVDGDVLVVRGGVWVGPEGSVGGDIDASGAITLTDGSIVDGTTSEGSVVDGLQTLTDRVRATMWIAVTIALLAVGLLFAWLAPATLDRARVSLRDRPFGAGLRGMTVLAVLSVLALIAFAAVAGGFVGVLLMAATTLLAVVGMTVAVATVGSVMTRSDRPVIGFLAGAIALRILALVPFIGDAVTILAAIVGTGALLRAIRRQATADEPTEAARAHAPVDVDADPPPSLLGGPDDRDLRVIAPDPEDRFARTPTATTTGWLDAAGAGSPNAGRPALDVSADEPLIDLRSDRTPAGASAPLRPGIDLFDSPPAPGGSAPQVIASLPVREDNYADDPGAAPGNGRRASLFADGPGAADRMGRALFADRAPHRTGHPNRLFRDAPTSDAAPTGPTGPASEPRPTDETRMPSTNVLDALSNLWADSGPDPDQPGNDGTTVDVRNRLFLDAPAAPTESTTVGGIFTEGSRAWRPSRN